MAAAQGVGRARTTAIPPARTVTSGSREPDNERRGSGSTAAGPAFGPDGGGYREVVLAGYVAVFAPAAGAARGGFNAAAGRSGRVGGGERLGQVDDHEDSRRGITRRRWHRDPLRNTRILPAAAGGLRAADVRRTHRAFRSGLSNDA